MTMPLIGTGSRFDVAANSSPPPCGEGSGVGVGRSGNVMPHGTTPHPTLPHKGEGVAAARHDVSSCLRAAVHV
jgi:hypothetical protein